MMRMMTVLSVVGFLAGVRGAEGAALVEKYIYLQKQGAVCRAQIQGDKDIWVSLSGDGIIWRIENLGCDEPAYVEIGSDISIGKPLPWDCQRTYKVPDDVNAPPTCLFPHQTSFGGTYGFQVYVNCRPDELCLPSDPEIVVERDEPFFTRLEAQVKPSRQRQSVAVTLQKVDGRCEAQLASSIMVEKEIKGIEWTFYNKCDKGPHYIDLRGVIATRDKPMLPKACNQSGAIRESPMVLRCHLENAPDTAGTYQYSVAVDCVGTANCARTKATIMRRR